MMGGDAGRDSPGDGEGEHDTDCGGGEGGWAGEGGATRLVLDGWETRCDGKRRRRDTRFTSAIWASSQDQSWELHVLRVAANAQYSNPLLCCNTTIIYNEPNANAQHAQHMCPVPESPFQRLIRTLQ